MYTSFYRLNSKPFENTPDPLFLFLSEQHREVLSALRYGIESAKGFILIAGDVGTGKTTLVKALLQEITPRHLVISIVNPRTNFDDIFNHLARQLGQDPHGQNRLESMKALQSALETMHKEGRRAVILIDEAHLLSEDSLEEIRLLSNIENEKTKLIQIILVGQNEIHPLLAGDKHRALRQRMVINRQLVLLNRNETKEYIAHRLRIAGRQSPLFEQSALELISRESQGAPRLINTLCDNALLIGYALGEEKIGKKIIKEVISDQNSGPLSRRGGRAIPLSRSLKWSAAVGGAALALLAAFWFTAEIGRDSATLRNKEIAVLTPQKPAAQSSKTMQQPQEILSAEKHRAGPPAPGPVVQEKDKAERVAESDVPLDQSSTLALPAPFVEEEEVRHVAVHPPLHKKKKLKVVGSGELLTELAYEHYGAVTETVLDIIHQSNPAIANIHHIFSGQKIFLPQITRDSMLVRGTDGRFHIHYASFYTLWPAQEATRKLTAQGTNAFLVPERQGENTLFRVYIGAYAAPEVGRKALETIDFKNLPFLHDQVQENHSQTGNTYAAHF